MIDFTHYVMLTKKRKWITVTWSLQHSLEQTASKERHLSELWYQTENIFEQPNNLANI